MKIMNGILSILVVCVAFANVAQCENSVNSETDNHKSNASERCALKPEGGPCKAIFDRYYYNPDSGECKEFMYGGCGGVVPFETMEECRKVCENPETLHSGADNTSEAISEQELAGKWMAYDKNASGLPVALKIPGDGFVHMYAIRTIPPFNGQNYDQWIFKPESEYRATAKSPGGEEMSLTIEKAGSEHFLELKMGEDAYLLLYRPWSEKDKTGFTGNWNMPALPVLDFAGDGLLSFPAGNSNGKGKTGTYAFLSGNRIAIRSLDKNSVDTVIAVLKQTDDPGAMAISVDENDYREAGANYDKPGGGMEQETIILVKGPTGDFYYQQPFIAAQIRESLESIEQAEYLNCYYGMSNLRDAMESYYRNHEKYTKDIMQLDQHTYECMDYGECAGSASKVVEEYCLPGAFTLELGGAGDDFLYRMIVKTKDEISCNICFTDSSVYPESYDGCPNEDVFCGDTMK